ncbi:MAG TPA: hypothetical protein VM221_01490 [Armatimonadota bacterium]|nr:hypothetical protein [Armatimonadota bacterium]
MSRLDTGKGSTFRFVCGIALAVVVALAVAYWLFVASLQKTVDQRLAQLRAKGLPTEWAQVIPPPVPDKDNAAILYQQAFDKFQGSRFFHDGYTLGKFVKGRAPGTRRKLAAEVQEILARNQAALDLVRAAADKPRCWFRLWNNASNPEGILFGHGASMRQCARLLSAEALIRSERGDTAGTVASCRTGLKLAAHAGAEPTLNGFLGRIILSIDTYQAIQQMIEEQALDPRACRDLFYALGESDVGGGIQKALGSELVSGRWLSFEEVDRLPRKAAYSDVVSLGVARNRRLKALAALYVSPLGKPLHLLDKIAYLDSLGEELPLAKKPYRESEPGYRELKRKLADLPSYCFIARGDPSDCDRFVVARDRITAMRDAMRVALALEAYHRKHGAYPDSLAALHADPGWKLPQDPFTGKDFGYGRQGDGFVLYSWGEDLDDDKGRPARPGAGIGGDGDMVWTFAR